VNAVRPYTHALAAELERPYPDGVTLHWLGQAGFVIGMAGRRLLIDPYLSDSLAAKYRGTATPHGRMAATPITPGELGHVDLALCTHQHTDHLDGATLAPLARQLPDLRFIVPAAAMQIACERIGVGAERLIPMDAGVAVTPLPGLTISGFRAAHETLERDAVGHYRFLGYGISDGHTRLFHSGDTVPFDGQRDEISAFAPQLMLLPVNGRIAPGFAGNLTLDEAISLAQACGAATLIAHHHGMFAFNTIDPALIDAAAAPLRVLRAKFGEAYVCAGSPKISRASAALAGWRP